MTQYERNKRWKENNKEQVAANQIRYRKTNGKESYKLARDKRRKKLYELLNKFLENKSCQQCPENRRPCLCFHHRDPSQKKMQVPQMVDHCYSWETILKEIDKCDILCHNCHAMLHSS